MKPSHYAKTAFGTPWGLFKILCMPFRLNGTAATFQRLTDLLLAPHVAYAAAYINDIVIFTMEVSWPIQALKAILRGTKSSWNDG